MSKRCNIKSMVQSQQSEQMWWTPTSKAPFFFPVTVKKLKFLCLYRKPKSNKSTQQHEPSFRRESIINNNPETCALNTENLRMLRSKEIVFPDFQDKVQKNLFPIRTQLKSGSQRSVKVKIVRRSFRKDVVRELLQQLSPPRQSYSCQCRVSTPARKARLECKSQRKSRSFARRGLDNEEIKIECSKSVYVPRKF